MNELQKIDLGVKKQGFETNNGVFYIDTSDFNVLTRFTEKQKEIDMLIEKYSELEKLNKTDITNDEIIEIGKKMRELDNQVKKITDFIFDDGVAEAVWGKSCCITSIDTVFQTLLTLYQKGIQQAMNESTKRVDKAIPNKYKGK